MIIDPQYQEFKADELIENKNTPFYCKHIAIIGYLDNFGSDSDMEGLAFLLWEHGASVSLHVSHSTDIVINGIGADEEDMYLIKQMKENGSDLKVYYQEDFECMLSEFHLTDWYSGGISTDERNSHYEKKKSDVRHFVAVDFEKLDDSQLSVCEIGLVEFKNGKEIDSFHSYINPIVGLKRNDWAKKHLHHITDEMLLNAPSYKELFSKLEQMIQDKPLVVHSKGADLNYIYHLEKQFGLPKLYMKWADTNEIAYSLGINQNLPGLYSDLFGTTFTEHHKAEDDARVCARIFERLSSKTDTLRYIHEEEYLPSEIRREYGAINSRHTQYGTATVAPDGLVFNYDKISDLFFFKGKKFAISGMSESDKSRIKSILEKFNAKYSSKPSGKTNVFIIDQNKVGPRKRDDAIRLQSTGLLVITDEYFWQLVQGI